MHLLIQIINNKPWNCTVFTYKCLSDNLSPANYITDFRGGSACRTVSGIPSFGNANCIYRTFDWMLEQDSVGGQTAWSEEETYVQLAKLRCAVCVCVCRLGRQANEMLMSVCACVCVCVCVCVCERERERGRERERKRRTVDSPLHCRLCDSFSCVLKALVVRSLGRARQIR
jgi:hypothetical protein